VPAPSWCGHSSLVTSAWGWLGAIKYHQCWSTGSRSLRISAGISAAAAGYRTLWSHGLGLLDSRLQATSVPVTAAGAGSSSRGAAAGPNHDIGAHRTVPRLPRQVRRTRSLGQTDPGPGAGSSLAVPADQAGLGPSPNQQSRPGSAELAAAACCQCQADHDAPARVSDSESLANLKILAWKHMVRAGNRHGP
jgi:hypothetical protein